MIRLNKILLLIGIFTNFATTSCKEHKAEVTEALAMATSETKTLMPKTKLTEQFKDYWYNSEAEITSFKLEQARYGEMREGQAVLVFVTEDFLPEKQVKAENYSEQNIPILKLNATKNFNTGIYPYSIMQSTFYPVANNQHALKISASIQEWCGHVYTQLNNRDKFEVTSYSYFQSEGDQSFTLEKTWTENELWAKLRVDPNSLPVGKIKIIPSLEFTRLKHKTIKAYEAEAMLENGSYRVIYQNLNRSLNINFNPNFPYVILGWEENMTSGYGPNAKTLTTKATKLETIKSAYWSKNNNADEALRAVLKLQ